MLPVQVTFSSMKNIPNFIVIFISNTKSILAITALSFPRLITKYLAVVIVKIVGTFCVKWIGADISFEIGYSEFMFPN